MKVEVRIELFSKHWKKILTLWEKEEQAVQLEGILGSVTGLFLEGSEEIRKIRDFYFKNKEELELRYNEIPRVLYSDNERRTFELHLIFCDLIFDSINLDKDYDIGGKCARCQKVSLPRRKGPLKIHGQEYKQYAIFSTDADEIVVNKDLKDRVEADSFKGAIFSPCYTPNGEVIVNYFEVNSVSNIGPRLAENGKDLGCPLCGQFDNTVNVKFPAWNIYMLSKWDESDIVFTTDTPPSLCGTMRFIELLSKFQDDISLDRCQPIHWYK